MGHGLPPWTGRIPPRRAAPPGACSAAGRGGAGPGPAQYPRGGEPVIGAYAPPSGPRRRPRVGRLRSNPVPPCRCEGGVEPLHAAAQAGQLAPQRGDGLPCASSAATRPRKAGAAGHRHGQGRREEVGGAFGHGAAPRKCIIFCKRLLLWDHCTWSHSDGGAAAPASRLPPPQGSGSSGAGDRPAAPTRAAQRRSRPPRYRGCRVPAASVPASAAATAPPSRAAPAAPQARAAAPRSASAGGARNARPQCTAPRKLRITAP